MQEKKYNLFIFGTAFTVLLIFAYQFGIQRVIFTDSAVALFKIANYETFYTTNYRFISILVELPAVIGVKLHATVKTIVYLYSFGYFIPEIITAFILIVGLKDYKNLIVLILLLVLLNNFDFYYTYAEFHKGINLCVLLLSVFQHKEKFKKREAFYGILFFLYVVIVFCHPLTIFCVLFILGYLFVEQTISFKELKIYSLIALLTAVLKFIFFHTGYETQKLKLTITLIRGNKLLEGFCAQLFNHNYVFTILFIIIITALYFKNKTNLLLLFLTFSLGYFIMICAVFGRLTYDHYGEYFFKPMTLFLAIPLVHTIYNQKKIQYVLLCTAIIISLCKIYHFRKVFNGHITRYEEILKVMEDNKINKALLSAQIYRFNQFDDRWASSYESLLLNAVLHKDETAKTFCLTYCMSCLIEENNKKITPFIDANEWINPYYFHLPEEKYVVIDSLYSK